MSEIILTGCKQVKKKGYIASSLVVLSLTMFEVTMTGFLTSYSLSRKHLFLSKLIVSLDHACSVNPINTCFTKNMLSYPGNGS